MKETDFYILAAILQNDPRTVRVAKIGLCRPWTGEAIKVAREFREKNKIAFAMEAREVSLEFFLSHTFLRILAGELNFLCDGTGTSKFPPFFGLEADAQHLLPSRLDPIHYYELTDEPDDF